MCKIINNIWGEIRNKKFIDWLFTLLKVVLIVLLSLSFIALISTSIEIMHYSFSFTTNGINILLAKLCQHAFLYAGTITILTVYIAYYRLKEAENDNKEKLKQFHFVEWRTVMESRFLEIEHTDPFMKRVFIRERRKMFDKLYSVNFAILNKKELTDLFSIFKTEIKNIETKSTYTRTSETPASFLNFRFLFLGSADADKLYKNIDNDLEELYKLQIDKK